MLGRGCSSLTIFLANVGTTPPFTVPGLKLDGTAADGVGIFLTVRVRPPKKTPPKHGLDGPPHGVGETHSPGRPPTGPLNFTSGDGGEFVCAAPVEFDTSSTVCQTSRSRIPTLNTR